MKTRLLHDNTVRNDTIRFLSPCGRGLRRGVYVIANSLIASYLCSSQRSNLVFEIFQRSQFINPPFLFSFQDSLQSPNQ